MITVEDHYPAGGIGETVRREGKGVLIDLSLSIRCLLHSLSQEEFVPIPSVSVR